MPSAAISNWSSDTAMIMPSQPVATNSGVQFNRAQISPKSVIVPARPLTTGGVYVVERKVGVLTATVIVRPPRSGNPPVSEPAVVSLGSAVVAVVAPPQAAANAVSIVSNNTHLIRVICSVPPVGAPGKERGLKATGLNIPSAPVGPLGSEFAARFDQLQEFGMRFRPAMKMTSRTFTGSGGRPIRLRHSTTIAWFGHVLRTGSMMVATLEEQALASRRSPDRRDERCV